MSVATESETAMGEPKSIKTSIMIKTIIPANFNYLLSLLQSSAFCQVPR
jgi:hypothetical protein